MDDVKSKLREALGNLDRLKTPACLDINMLGLFTEQKLSETEMTQAESHIGSCLYCLGKVIELKEILYCASEAEPVSPELEKKLSGLLPKRLS